MTPMIWAVFVLAACMVYPAQSFGQYAGGPLMDSSIPYVGGRILAEAGYDGTGIIVAVIDTGVDFGHPDLSGSDSGSPQDIDGHGTEVAGIIAANGSLRGMAPGVTVLSYKISDDGLGVSAEKIVSAIYKAVADGAEIINISLGVNKTNPHIDGAVTEAAAAGILVVSAAGNDGPGSSSIGSPGINPNALTVGATYNNVSSSIVASLRVDGEYFNAAPMIGTAIPDGPLESRIVHGAYARESDLREGSYAGAIILAERGSNVTGQMVFFTEKESAAADAGAVALIVYNSEEGMFLGDLLHNNTDSGYEPRILAVSVSREDGLRIGELAFGGAVGTLETLRGIDTVTHFSSRGPVSPFYIKPDLVAPGAYINTTSIDGGYEISSGTSFAAPHVTGTAAAILEKNPGLSASDVRSIITTTADASGSAGPHEEGSGRLNVTRAFAAGTILDPPHLIIHLSPEKPSAVGTVHLRPVDGRLGEIRASVEIAGATADVTVEGRSVAVSVSADPGVQDSYYGRLLINDGTVEYGVPVMATMTGGSLEVETENGTLSASITGPPGWSYAKIRVEDPHSGWSQTQTARPGVPVSFPLPAGGTYWVGAAIDVAGKSHMAYAVAESDEGSDVQTLVGIPFDVFAIAAAVFVLAYAARRALRD